MDVSNLPSNSPHSRALEGLSPEEKQRLLQTGFDRGISPEDPAWVLVELLVDTEKIRKETQKLAEQVLKTSSAITGETAALPKKVAEGAATASKTIREVIFEELNQKANTITEVMTNNIREVAGQLPAAAERQKIIILKEWREELAAAARSERIIQSLGAKIIFGTLLLVFMGLGAGGGYLAETSLGWLPVMSSPYGVSFEGNHILVKNAGRIVNCPALETGANQICLTVLP